MNKKELIDYCNALKENKSQIINCIDVNGIIKRIEQLDEPEKVKVPQFVAEYIKYTRSHDWDLQDAMDSDFIASEEDGNFSDWFYTDDNMELFARAWLDGYEVEKEPKYIVKLKGVYHGDLGYAEIFNGYSFYNKDRNPSGIKYEHTRKELEEAGFGWVFDCEGIEIEEVE